MKINAVTVPSIHFGPAGGEDKIAHVSIHVDMTLEDDEGNKTGCDLAVIIPFDPKATIEELMAKGLEGARKQLAAASDTPAEDWTRLQRESLEFKPLAF